MVIRIPSLSERSIEERLNLISEFFTEEALRLGKRIKVSVNSMRAFLSYNCPNNIGQLKTDIQLTCAKAYADYISNSKDDIEISSLDLPPYIREGLYSATEHRKAWDKLASVNGRFLIFDGDGDKPIFIKSEVGKNIYEMIESRYDELRKRGASAEEIGRVVEKDIEEYFSKYIQDVNTRIDISSIENIIHPDIVKVVKEIINYSEKRLNKVFSEKIYCGMAVHISNSIERIKRNKKIVNPRLNKIRTKYKNEFNVALDCIKIIDRALDVSMPIDEAGFLAMFFVYDEMKQKNKSKSVKVIVISHGKSTATSMAETANKLLGVQYAIGINAPLDEKPQNVLSSIKKYIQSLNTASDILFLVDMGSLTNFGKELEKELNIKTKTIPLVSTLHVIEATRKALMGYTLHEVYKDTLAVNTFFDNQLTATSQEGNERKLAILTICTTGEGSAIAIKNMLEKQLVYDESILDIVPVNLVDEKSIYARLHEFEKQYKVLCLISSFSLDIDIPQFDLNQILNLQAVEQIQQLIDGETALLKMEETLDNHLTNINGKTILKDIKVFINNIEQELNIKLSMDMLVGIIFHMACVVDKLIKGDAVKKFRQKEKCIAENPKLYDTIKIACGTLNRKYDINITDDEICYIMQFFQL